MDSSFSALSPAAFKSLPVISALLAQLVPTIVLAYVPASSSTVRRWALLVVTVFSLHAVIFMPAAIHNFVWRTTSAALTAILAFRSCDVLCLNPISLNGNRRPVAGHKDGSIVQRQNGGFFHSDLFSGWRLLWNMRGIGTQRSIRGVTPFSKSDPDYVPTKARFLAGHVVRVVVAVVVMDFFARQVPENVPVNYSFAKQHVMWRLSEVDREEVFLRVSGTIGFWVNMAGFIAAMYSCLAVLFVGILGLDAPADWPPVFGSVLDAWTVQRFWGLVWHQTLRSILSSNCDFVLLSLLRLPRQSLLTRHARLAASFALSGVLHHVVDALVGVPLQESGMFKFMSIQWIGIVIEDFVRFVWRKMGGRLPGCTARTLGYAWLCLWLVWTSPGVFYPYSRIADGTRQEHGMLPFTLKDS